MKKIVFKTKDEINSNKVLFDFLDRTCINLNEEFRLYLEQDLYKEKEKVIDDIFRAEERTLLGLFSNAIVRGSTKNQTYQEYGVLKKEKYIGRADMFVMTPNFQIVVEAKKWRSSTLKFSHRQLSDLLGQVWEQGLKYYNGETSNLKEKPYLMTLVFDWYEMKNDSDLSEILDYPIDNTRDGVNYFTAYQQGNNILMVYGWIG